MLYTLITAKTISGFWAKHNPTVYIRGSYVFFGGYFTDIIAKLDGKSFKWSKIGKLNDIRKHHGAIMIGDTVFVVGNRVGYGFVVFFSRKATLLIKVQTNTELNLSSALSSACER